MFPGIEYVVIDSDWEQNVCLILIFPLEGTLDFTKHRATLKGILRTHEQQLVVVSNGASNLSPKFFTRFSVLREVVTTDTPFFQIVLHPFHEFVVFCGV